MQCPNCYSSISTRTNTCPHCAYSFHIKQAAWPNYSELHQQDWTTQTYHSQVPGIPTYQIEQFRLTAEQQQSLRMKAIGALLIACMPTGFVIFFLAQYRSVGFFSDSIVTVPLTIIGLIGIGVSILLIWKGLVVQLFQDASEGIGIRQIDVLEKTYRIYYRGSTKYYGYFRQIGSVVLNHNQYINTLVNVPYQVSYSPNSKHLWAMTLLNPDNQPQ